MDEEVLRDYLPASFGGNSADNNIETQIEKARRQGFAKKPEGKDDDSAGEHDGSSSDSDDSDDDDEYPVSHELVFKTHDRAVTSITLDTSGARMITGSTDCTLKFHDFASMAPNTIRAFKSVDPTATKTSANSETHPIHVAKFNPSSGSQVLVITATPQARVLSRDGEVEFESVKGDMYLRDMNMTKGHVSEITSGTWHPTNWDRFVTAGTDSTLRIWDVNQRAKQADIIVHKSKQAGAAGRSRITAVAWGSVTESTNTTLVAAALDGSLLMWGGEGPYHRPVAEVRDAHKSDTWTSGVDISPDGRLVVTRGGDDTIKIWDTRKFKSPVNTVAHPSTSQQYPTSNIIFAPNSTAILTGSVDGSLHILNPATLKPELVTPVTPSSPLITVQWHPKLNQIITGSANAETHILFDPKTSTKGAVSILSRLPKRRHIDDDATLTTDYNSLGVSGDAILNPGTTSEAIQTSTYASRHPTIGLTASGKSRDPRRPHLPAQTPFAKSQPDEKHIKERIPFSSMREEDPREALLKYADKAQNDPMFTKAWRTTQPKTIYADASDEEEEEQEGGARKKQKT
ncbi:hypothetical protein H2198_004362 [Neophaeococcomyces mojaviensis]|uniref:Uncharacterized protein n=1 Tax=Neophaeococcomyces mojaviensis TaxID=3383035 RepID=A0ACC3A8Q4_9EURO|nr:hypothetical protein H2198_004362 [Knufia sp. JES_112]